MDHSQTRDPYSVTKFHRDPMCHLKVAETQNVCTSLVRNMSYDVYIVKTGPLMNSKYQFQIPAFVANITVIFVGARFYRSRI